MKKLLSTIALGSVLATVASADFLRVEAGAGARGYTPSGTITYTDPNYGTLTNISSQKAQTSEYVWMLIKHPIPLLPNLRLEYSAIHDEGKVTATSNGWNIPLDTPYTLDVTEYDVIPYYNLLDNTFWTTVDAGIDIKMLQSNYTAKGKGTGIGPFQTGDYNRKDFLPIPLAYLRTRIEIPLTGLGLEADGKYITYGGNTVYDVRAKVDYTLDFIPVVQPGIEIGYRAQHVDIESTDKTLKAYMDFKGVYFGAMVKF